MAVEATIVLALALLVEDVALALVPGVAAAIDMVAQPVATAPDLDPALVTIVAVAVAAAAAGALARV